MHILIADKLLLTEDYGSKITTTFPDKITKQGTGISTNVTSKQ